jgi:hypothetical protein
MKKSILFATIATIMITQLALANQAPGRNGGTQIAELPECNAD